MLDLKKAFAEAKPGDVIAVPPGSYGNFSVAGRAFDPPIIFVAQEPENAPVLRSIKVSKAKGVHFFGLKVDMVPTMETLAHSSAVLFLDSDDVAFVGGSIHGGVAINGVDPAAPVGTRDKTGNVLGARTGRGVTIQNTTRAVVTHTEIFDFMKGVVLSRAGRGLVVSDNDIHHTRTGMISGTIVGDAEIDRNHVWSSNPHNFSGAGDHADFIHIWTENGQVEPTDNLSVCDNFAEQGDGTPILGIYLDDNGQGVGFKNARIDQNLIHNANFQGLRLEHVYGSTALNNVLRLPPGAPMPNAKIRPSILLRTGKADVDGVLVEGNDAGMIDDDTGVPNRIGVNTLSKVVATPEVLAADKAAWLAKYRPAPPAKPAEPAPVRDELRDLIRQSTVVKQEALKTKGRISFDWKTPAEADAFLSAVLAHRAASPA